MMANVPWCHDCDEPDALCKCGPSRLASRTRNTETVVKDEPVAWQWSDFSGNWYTVDTNLSRMSLSEQEGIAIASAAAHAGRVRPLFASPPSPAEVTFQDRVAEAHIALFHDDPTDIAERRNRFYEEATEAAQSLGMTEDEAHQLVAYTFSRPPGDARKEIGATALTLASLCVVGGWDMMECAEADLAALVTPEKIAKVRAKRATRHGRGPLPGLDALQLGKEG